MDRLRRNAPDDKVRTSQLIQELAARRERKLQGKAAHGAAGSAGDVAAASAVPLPSSFDEEEQMEAASSIDTTTSSSKPLSWLVRRDKAGQQGSTASGANAADVDGLASLLQGVGISEASKQGSTRPGRQQRPAAGRDSSEDAIEDDDFDSSAVGRTAGAPAQRRGASSAGSSRPSTQAALASDDGTDEDEDVASVDTADSDSDGAADASSSSTQQQGLKEGPAGQSAAPLVLEGGFVLDGSIARKLYPHQIHGVQWLWSLHR